MQAMIISFIIYSRVKNKCDAKEMDFNSEMRGFGVLGFWDPCGLSL